MVAPSSCFLGLDIGTEGCKTTVSDLRGKVLAHAYVEYEVEVPKPVWAEQNPRTWWNAIRKNASMLLRRKTVGKNDIAGIGVTGQSPVVVPVNKQGTPLLNAIIWIDQRASGQAHKMAEETGVIDDPSMSLPKILWIKQHRPKEFLRTYKFLQATDFINLKLTGKFSTDSVHAITLHYDPDRKRWPEELLNRLGLSTEKLPSVFNPTEVIGTVSETAAKETGLKAGTPVASCGIDTYTAIIGTNATDIGSVCEVTGSGTSLMVPSKRRITDPKGRIHCHKLPLLPNHWIVWSTMSTTGASLKWFRNNFYPPRTSFANLDQEALKSPSGSDELIFLPYLMGERSPIWDKNARGVFLGFSLKHSRSHFVRAILEGCAFGIRQNLETMESIGIKIKEIRSCGGTAASRVFGQIKADIIGKTVIVPQEINASSMGAAIAAAVSVKAYPTLEKAACNMVNIQRQINAQPNSKEKYNCGYEMYKEAYMKLKDYFAQYCSSETFPGE
jgi:xylulokinase